MFRSPINKVKAICVGALIVSQGSMAFAGDAASSVRAQLNRIRGGTNSSFCYVVENGQVQGVNADKPVRIASVMKLMTSFWALEKLGGPNFRWRTKIYYQASNGEMHIEGARDPFFHRDRLYLLISDMNRMGIKSLNRLTADSNFRLGSGVTDTGNRLNEGHRNNSQIVATKEDLMDSFNTSVWWGSRKGTYARIRKENQTPQLLPTVTMKVEAADIVPSNPLAGKPGVKVWEVRSAPLRYYLKRMNIMSANPMADELYYSLGGSVGFRKFLEDTYKMGNAADDVHTGSGLPAGPPRNDTSMSCSAVVRLIRRMDLNLEQKHGMDLADVVMLSGVDTLGEPTFKDGSKALTVKTGTLTAPGLQAKNLAGSMSTTQGDVYFGIFMQGRAATAGARQSVLNAFMSKYTRKSVSRKSFNFDALDNEMQLRPWGGATPAAPAPAPAQTVAAASASTEHEIVVTARRPAAPAVKPASKPVARTVAKPAAKPVAKPVAKAAAKPAPKKPIVAAKPVAKKPVAVAKPAAKKPAARTVASRK